MVEELVVEVLIFMTHRKRNVLHWCVLTSSDVCHVSGKEHEFGLLALFRVDPDRLVDHAFIALRFIYPSGLIAKKAAFFGGRIPAQKQERKE